MEIRNLFDCIEEPELANGNTYWALAVMSERRKSLTSLTGSLKREKIRLVSVPGTCFW